MPNIQEQIDALQKALDALKGNVADTTPNPRKVKLFHNFTLEPFEWTWNGKVWRFAPGSKKYMPAYLAEHFAKHLTNRELDKKHDDVSKSPSKPESMPAFMELFNRACIDENPNDNSVKDEAEAETEVLNKQAAATGMPEFVEDPEKKGSDDWAPEGEPHVIEPKPDPDDDNPEFKNQ